VRWGLDWISQGIGVIRPWSLSRSAMPMMMRMMLNDGDVALPAVERLEESAQLVVGHELLQAELQVPDRRAGTGKETL
jgi:hypothetical protein